MVSVIKGAAYENGFLLLFVRHSYRDAGCLLVVIFGRENFDFPFMDSEVYLIASISDPIL